MENSVKDGRRLLIGEKWSTVILVPAIAGLATFFSIRLFSGENSLFWAISVGYLFLEFFISRGKTSVKSSFFERINITTSVIVVTADMFGAFYRLESLEFPIIIIGFLVLLLSMDCLTAKSKWLYFWNNNFFDCQNVSKGHFLSAFYIGRLIKKGYKEFEKNNR